MAITIEITLKEGATRAVIIDPDELTLGFLDDVIAASEAKQAHKVAAIITKELGFTPEEHRQIRAGDFKRIAAAIQGVSQENSVPLASA